MEQISNCTTLHEGQHIQAAREWRPTSAIRLSVAVHVTAVAALALDPLSWEYVVATLAGNHLVLGMAGMWPRSTLIGSNIRRLPDPSASRREIALTFDDGPHPTATPQVLDLLDQYQAKASFFCVGAKAAAYPSIVQEIARRGHSIENHTQTHPAAFATYGMTRLRREVESCQETLARICGRRPTFFRAPAGLRNPLLDPVLARQGLECVSWTRRAFDTVDPNGERVLNRLIHKLDAGDVLALHDGDANHDRPAASVMNVLPRLLEEVRHRKLNPVSLTIACAG